MSMRVTDSSMYVQVEELVEKTSNLTLGYKNEGGKEGKFIRILSNDKAYDKNSVYVIYPHAIERYKVRGKTEYFVNKVNIIAEIEKNVTEFIARERVDLSKMKDVRGGIPRVEYI